ncbi:RidA family protein [Rhodohalobacter sulfatireducens]|uniref:RidA family protein n=1 Tax=Rhodohalobacter sulfatireducens TaxID=2911366 RepID=A0ABS9KH46_9BACT|nr:RidA family protein [Rhodohalobacter sulfatireducens]MCG2590177.1 RidA family protein [Rhodohalobacter sulfatireducens]MDR9365239.1 RidA family protein [Balneolaceae bacterium]MDR9409494.1 RidA family protein [Balneolaceae bacterium]
MLKKIVKTKKAPAAIGPYSQAVVHQNTLYCSGQIALDPESMEIISDDVGEQTRQVMKNLEQVLLEAGSSFGKVLKCSIFLANMDDFADINEIYGSYFPENPPARETVEVSRLPKDVKIEISCVAYI